MEEKLRAFFCTIFISETLKIYELVFIMKQYKCILSGYTFPRKR